MAIAAADIIHPQHGPASMVWTYRTAAGEPMGMVARFDTTKGKEVLPYDLTAKRFKAWWAEKRPLYGLELLAEYPKARVVLVEGEKAAEAARILLPSPKFVCVTWIGGVNVVDKVDWSPLAGRDILFWPDNDAQGFEAMIRIKGFIEMEEALL